MKTIIAYKSSTLPVLLLICAVGLSTWGFSQQTQKRTKRDDQENNGNHNGNQNGDHNNNRPVVSKDPVIINAANMIAQGRQIFRSDTYGDEAFWGDTLRLHQAIEGAQNGGVGPGLSPSAALGLGLKVDVDALPPKLINDLKKGRVDLNDPAVTLSLLKLDAVLGVKEFVALRRPYLCHLSLDCK